MNAMDMKNDELGMTTNAIELLTQDHQTIEQAIARLENAGDKTADINAQNELNVENFKKELLLHSLVEQQIFYPALKANQETADLIPESENKHSEIENLISKIKQMSPDSREFQQHLSQIKSEFQNHVEEDNKLFKESRHILGEQKLDELGRQILQMKQRENPQAISASAV